MDLPQTLHGQLYLLAYDRKRHRFDVYSGELFGFALRAAMLTDLYLTGHLEDKGGTPYPSSVARPGDPVLRAAFDQIGVTGRKGGPSCSPKISGMPPESCATSLKPPVGYACSSAGCSASFPPPASGSTTKKWSAVWPTQ